MSACLTETRSQLKGLARAEDTLDACTNAAMLVASAAVPRLRSAGSASSSTKSRWRCQRSTTRSTGPTSAPLDVDWQPTSVAS